MPTRRSVLSGLLALLAAPFARWRAPKRSPEDQALLAEMLGGKPLRVRATMHEPVDVSADLDPFWHEVAAQFDILIADGGDGCAFCDAALPRGALVRMVPEPGGSAVSWSQCAACAANDLLWRTASSVDQGGLVRRDRTLAQIPTVRAIREDSIGGIPADPILRHARFTMLVEGGTCICGADLAPGALVALLPDPRAEQIDGLGADGPALVVYEASCAAPIILPRWDKHDGEQRERYRKVFEEEARVLAAARATA